jgi:hypothetical protein
MHCLPEITFGGFDVITGSDGTWVVEVNSAPMMTAQTAEHYVNFFKAFAPPPAPVITAETPLAERAFQDRILPAPAPSVDTVYLTQSLASFERDPADTDFQRGYQACLQEMLRVVQGR